MSKEPIVIGKIEFSPFQSEAKKESQLREDKLSRRVEELEQENKRLRDVVEAAKVVHFNATQKGESYLVAGKVIGFLGNALETLNKDI